MKVQGIITLLTDFGLKDVYVSAMKGVILSISSSVIFVDISHNVSRYNILQGAFLLSTVSSYFPMGTIHLAVIDPGVGTFRRRIVIKGKRCLYVGPDNGLLLLAAKAEGIEKAVEIKGERFISPFISTTFEGRDIFAPVAANLLNGLSIEDLGPEIHDLVEPIFIEPEVKGDRIMGLVVHIDRFGNLITNISKRQLENLRVIEGVFFEVNIGSVSKIIPFCRTYSDVPDNFPLVIVGSSGFLEVSVHLGSAMALFKAVIGSKVDVIISTD